MMIYHQIKFACQEINSSEDIVESYFDHMSPCCDLDLEDSKQLFSPHDTLGHDDTPPYQVW